MRQSGREGKPSRPINGYNGYNERKTVITAADLDRAYESSKSAKITQQLEVKPGDLATWLQTNLTTIADRWNGSSLHIAVELVGIGILAARADEHKN